ncbi:hypothetical protein A2230_03935 [candidate division WOR-1 bacterium RIFOXYA2_FULL_36_21]|uniref:Uncharacterized protein n=1 Tax=candidate division WOR-1 bacterium RIFOXYB2_FULL_36_35 TaxID=1802578 RepID=A0A1F4S0Z6_UNCSA|nr:MAG: hypothetical protein A2230_03935 [candidate division WOR-1 bacterium RIFOXYA2_FULL_36_21]OGC14116.1 MAG: hypothetical protein A2290_06405 [candidate division WOR-1 bacterium RIFOXYB2_FULL_36_35]OGC16508.1 MAG: hypothetical protein A2282_02105 [candidate division WOR-1 bacterium RIFOXYA12_FULL_36_13]
MIEDKLPKELLEKTSKYGNELAWKLNDVEEVVVAAEKLGLANLGGQAQFIFPEGIYELYWIEIDTNGKTQDEDWLQYVSRSNHEFLRLFKEKILKTDFLKEAQNWPALKAKIDQSINILDCLYFVIYFVDAE